jgi:hypothetical protein
VPQVEQVRAELYLEKWPEARNAKDAVAAGFFREKVAEHDIDGRLGAQLRSFLASFESTPSGADVYLFRLVEQADLVEGGDHRLVPVPVGGAETPVPPGTWVLRVARALGDIERWDLILEVAGHPIRDTILVLEGNGEIRPLERLVRADGTPVKSIYDIESFGHARVAKSFEFERTGKRYTIEAAGFDALGIRCGTSADAATMGGAAARLYHFGELRDVTLPKGLEVRSTAAPLFVSERCHVGRTLTTEIALEEGRYLALYRRAGREDLLMQVILSERERGAFICTLLPEGTTPPGFVAIYSGGEPPRFFIMEREVTAGEYLEFLNDPATLKRIDESQEPILYPRHVGSPDQFWKRTETGYVLAGDWRHDWPVLGVSWNDATAYAAWRTERARRNGERIEYSLPNLYEWNVAGGGIEYPFGTRFRAKWAKSCFSRPQAMPEPVLRFPIDESPLGVFDMCGSASEWLDEWWDEARNLRRIGGGSWGYGKPNRFHLYGEGAGPHVASGTYGFRLIARVKR